ncbi:MAG TPA: hypothetical protein VHF06_10620 [Pseudonocardiaceae bacterium]|jgi:hypothetical protein|nr:hypothetical protein [Pseudonocardiaceae bacterium]
MTDNERMLIEQAMPGPDYILTEEIVLPVTADEAFDAVCAFDMTDVRDRASRMALWLRALPERLSRRVDNRQRTRFTVDDLVIGTDWILLGRRPGAEVALGAVGRFWTPVVRWKAVTPEEYAEFANPRWGKIAMSFIVLPYGERRSVVAYEVRIAFFDEATRRMFDRYWWSVRPFVARVLRGMLHTIRDTAIDHTAAAARIA